MISFDDLQTAYLDLRRFGPNSVSIPDFRSGQPRISTLSAGLVCYRYIVIKNRPYLPIDYHLAVLGKDLGETIMAVHTSPAEMESQDLPIRKLDRSDSVIGIPTFG
jgi:hypothetical protein